MILGGRCTRFAENGFERLSRLVLFFSFFEGKVDVCEHLFAYERGSSRYERGVLVYLRITIVRRVPLGIGRGSRACLLSRRDLNGGF